MSINELIEPKERGFATPLVLFAVLILFLLSVGLLRLGLNSRIFAIRAAQEITAGCAADAGLTKAVWKMNEKLKTKTWDNPTFLWATDEALPNCDATFSYTVTGDTDSGFTIESTGKSVQAEERVYATVGLQGLFEYAISAQGTLIFKNDTLIDGYNSLDPGDTDVEVKIATNSILPDSIILNNGMTVNGEVLVGVDGDVETVIKDQGATTGDRHAIPEEIEFPDVTPPVLTDMGKEIGVKGTTLTIGPDDSGKYEKIKLDRKSDPGILEIAGGEVVLHITGDIDMGQDCEIQIREGASLVLYLDGDLDADNNAGFNNLTCIPASFKLYGTGEPVQQWDVKAKSDVSGAVYAPEADIIVFAGGDVYGSVVAHNFEFKSGGNFYYDEALRKVSVDDDGVRFIIKRWREE